MGNQTSQSANNKIDQEHIKLLLDKWSIEEKSHLQQYIINNIDVSKLDIQKLIQQSHNNLPTYFDKQLSQVFDLYISQKGSSTSNTITYRQFLDILHSFIDGTSLQNNTYIQPSESFLALFTLANQQCNLSFKAFISLIVKVGIRLWFMNSNKVNINEFDKKENEDGSTYHQQQIKLINTLLYSVGYLEQQKKKDGMDDWLQDNNSNDNNKEEDDSQLNKSALDKWSENISQSSFPFDDDNSKSYIISWYDQTNGFKILFQLVVKCYYFGHGILHNRNDDQLHQLKIKYEQSPYIDDLLSSSLLTPYDYFYLSLQLPSNALSWSTFEKSQHKVKEDVHHQRLYSSRYNGNSWQRFIQSIVQQGATLLLIKSKKDGSIFGGYTDEPWQLMTDWYGSSFNFLFQLSGHYSKWNMFGVWHATNINDHYQYLCWGKKSLPNGLGMGGQFDYSGLWINADFIHGHSRGGPYCSTYQSPQLTDMDQFEIDEVEAWLVRPLIRDEEEEGLNGDSILNRNEDMEFLEMAGKKLYSRDLGKPDNDNEEEDGK